MRKVKTNLTQIRPAHRRRRSNPVWIIQVKRNAMLPNEKWVTIGQISAPDRWGAEQEFRRTHPKYRDEDLRAVLSKKNPADAADSAFESFHGEPSSETVVIEDQIHEHEHLWTCGRLMQLCVVTLTGKYLELDWEGRPDGEIPYLACSEDGKQLYIEGGDQELDLTAIGMDSERWVKDRMVIGEFASKDIAPVGDEGSPYNITYQGRKNFDNFQLIDYQHLLGEQSKELRNPAAPFLEYEPRNKKLYITGGQYIINKPLFGTSPGIEN